MTYSNVLNFNSCAFVNSVTKNGMLHILYMHPICGDEQKLLP
jgi:hypothetical protein